MTTGDDDGEALARLLKSHRWVANSQMCECGWEYRGMDAWLDRHRQHLADAVLAAGFRRAGTGEARLTEAEREALTFRGALTAVENHRDALAATVERVRALTDEWESTVYKLPHGYPMTVNEFCRNWFKSPLRAALAAQPTDGGES